MDIPSGTAVMQMTTAKRSIDLLMLLSEGLTEGRLTRLLRRWSKRTVQRGEERSMDAGMADDDNELPPADSEDVDL